MPGSTLPLKPPTGPLHLLLHLGHLPQTLQWPLPGCSDLVSLGPHQLCLFSPGHFSPSHTPYTVFTFTALYCVCYVAKI